MYGKNKMPDVFFAEGFNNALNVLVTKIKMSDAVKAYITDRVGDFSGNKRIINEIQRLLSRVFVFNNSQFLNVKEWENELARRRIVRKDVFLRFLLRKFKRDITIDYVHRLRMSLFMTKISRNGLSTRVRNRDMVDAHPRAYFRRYGASRHTIAELQREGHIPGLAVASW